jgi:hypothetical protein
MEASKGDLLSRTITELGFSEAFIHQSQSMGLVRLKDIGALTPMELTQKAGFSYRWLEELTGYLSQNKLLSLLQPLPGNSEG